MTGVPAVAAQVKAGKLRALGVSGAGPVASTTRRSRHRRVRSADFEAIQWYGVVAPAGTPAPIVERLNAEINRALASPELRARLDAEGAEAAPGTPGRVRLDDRRRDRALEARRSSRPRCGRSE